MIEVVAKTRRQLNRLQKQVSENQGDLEERIATDIANLNRRCKELQNAVDHESLRATHECNGLKNSLTADLGAFSKATSTHFAELEDAVLRKTGQMVDDISSLQTGLAAERNDREVGEANCNAKISEQTGKLKDFLMADMNARTQENNDKHKVVESSLQNVFMNLQQERQMREDEIGTVNQSLYDEASTRHSENTALSELVERLVSKVRGGMHTDKLPLRSELGPA
eukprot:SAG22_NODE_1822_length_3511_cov_5.060082_2_plen_226_part_00